MRDRDFCLVWMDALTLEKAVFMSQWASLSAGGVPKGISDKTEEEIADEMENIWNVAHMCVKDICKEANLTQGQMAARFHIPKRTMEDWCRGVSKCADYTRLMMAECLGILKEERSKLSGLNCDITDLGVRDFCTVADMSQNQLAVRFCIPQRTLEDWCRGISKCPDYIRQMIAECVGFLDQKGSSD